MKVTSYAFLKQPLILLFQLMIIICKSSGYSSKGRGVLIYYKGFLSIKLIDVKYLHESMNFQLRIGGKVCKFLSLYSSPSQNKDAFETFLENLELNFDHMA